MNFGQEMAGADIPNLKLPHTAGALVASANAYYLSTIW